MGRSLVDHEFRRSPTDPPQLRTPQHGDLLSLEAKYRRLCARNLCRFYEIINTAGMFLTDAEHSALHKAVIDTLVSYQWLARFANDAGRLVWSVVNKHHFYKHLSDQAKYMNPRMVWCYMAEDPAPVQSDSVCNTA